MIILIILILLIIAKPQYLGKSFHFSQKTQSQSCEYCTVADSCVLFLTETLFSCRGGLKKRFRISLESCDLFSSSDWSQHLPDCSIWVWPRLCCQGHPNVLKHCAPRNFIRWKGVSCNVNPVSVIWLHDLIGQRGAIILGRRVYQPPLNPWTRHRVTGISVRW